MRILIKILTFSPLPASTLMRLIERCIESRGSVKYVIGRTGPI